MSISAVSSNLVNDLQQQQNPFQQIRQDFKQLASALQSGDLSDAQSAYSSIQQVLQANSGTSSSNSSSNGSGLLQGDFSTLGQALQSGDLSGAQSALSQLESDFQAGRQSGSDGAQTAVPKQPPVQDEYVPASQTPSPAQQVQQDYSQLAGALQSGNLTNAQSAFAALQQVLQSQAGTNGAANTSSTTTATADPIVNDLNTLGQALSSGSLTQAQSAFSQLQTDVQTAEQANASPAQGLTQGTSVEGHHHHHRHGGGGSESTSSSSATDSSGNSAVSDTSSGVSVYG